MNKKYQIKYILTSLPSKSRNSAFQLTFTCSNLITETLEEGAKYVRVSQ